MIVCLSPQQRLGATQAEIQEKIHDRVKQMDELKQAVDSLKVSKGKPINYKIKYIMLINIHINTYLLNIC